MRYTTELKIENEKKKKVERDRKKNIYTDQERQKYREKLGMNRGSKILLVKAGDYVKVSNATNFTKRAFQLNSTFKFFRALFAILQLSQPDTIKFSTLLGLSAFHVF